MNKKHLVLEKERQMYLDNKLTVTFCLLAMSLVQGENPAVRENWKTWGSVLALLLNYFMT